MTKTTVKKWRARSTAADAAEDEAARAIFETLSLSLPTAKLLSDRGCAGPAEAERFIRKSEEQLYDPFLMRDMRAAAQRVCDAVSFGEKILIYGDYDVDGVTSVSALMMFLKGHGADVGYYIPKRASDGYGISIPALERLADEGYRLMVTVDTGITAVDEIKKAKELGYDVVVTDHHECREVLPDAVAVVNPKRPDCEYPFDELAGVGVVFKLMCAVESLLDPGDPMANCVRRVAAEYCDLIAIGTIADVMPVTDENRLIISYGLQLIERGKRPALDALIRAAAEGRSGAAKKKITASFIGYSIAPRINAAGRMYDASEAVELFTTDDAEKAGKLAARLCEINKERQATENEIVNEAYEMIGASHDVAHDPVIVLSSDNWHHGIIGIVASRITERFGLSSILVSFEGEGNDGGEEDVGKGSGRSVKGVNLVGALAACSDLLEKYGGHELAAGLSVKRKNLDAFRKKINDHVRDLDGEYDDDERVDADLELLPSDVTLALAEELYLLEPFGTGNPVPVFLMKDVYIHDEQLVGGGKHTRFTLKKEDMSTAAICFRRSVSDIDLYPGDTADVLFNLDVNDFGGVRTAQMIVRDIRLSEGAYEAEQRQKAIFEAAVSSGVDALGLTDAERALSVPDRDDFVKVYSTLRDEIRQDHRVFGIRALHHLLLTHGYSMNYVKLRVVIAVFRELDLLGVEESEGTPDVFTFSEVETRGKTNLDNSALLSKIRNEILKNR